MEPQTPQMRHCLHPLRSDMFLSALMAIQTELKGGRAGIVSDSLLDLDASAERIQMQGSMCKATQFA